MDKIKMVLLAFAFVGRCSSEENTKDKICSLDDDIQDFIALFPTDDYTAIVKDYLKNDAEFKRSQEYIASLEFAEIFDRASGSPRYKAVEKFLKKAGHNGVVEMMRHGPPQPKKSAHPRSGNGTRAMHDDFIKILPHDKIKALFDKKMNDSSAFQHFVRSVQSEQFQSLLTELDQDPDFVHLKKSLLDHGVDVQDIYTLYEQLLGFKMFTALRPLEGSAPKGARTEL